MGLDDEVKDTYDELNSAVSKTGESETFFLRGNSNGHTVSNSYGYVGICGGSGYGEHNREQSECLILQL